jgi:hypothetical protein
MKMNNNFEEKLGKVIEQLPEFEPDNFVWAKIEAQLVFEEKLGDEKLNLPEINFSNKSWEYIDYKLDNKVKPIKKIVLYALSVAATIVIIFGISGIFNKNQDVRITYSKEQITANESLNENEDPELNPLEFIEQNCLAKKEICNSPEFKEQKKALSELENERKKITKTINMYGESPILIKSLIKIENLKSEIIKDLIKKMNS